VEESSEEAQAVEAEKAEAEPAAAAAPVQPAKPAARRWHRFTQWLREKGAWTRQYYLTIDPRTLGFFRLVLGFLVTADCVRHWVEARWFYSNSGVLTNHYHLFRPSSGYNFSIYHAFSSLAEVHVAFALSFFCYFCFWIGWHTRLFSILSFVLVTSMDNRLVMVENGGYVVVNLIVCWAMFLPTGRRFSVDALIRSYRERIEQTVDDLNGEPVAPSDPASPGRAGPAWETEPYVSGIVLLATLNVAAVYFFNVINKSGQIWRNGDTAYFVLHLDRMVTGVAVFLREHLPLWSTRVLSWGVLSVEALVCVWILAPYGRRFTRPLAMAGMWALHTGFGVMMRLGPFSWFMIGWSFLLPTAEHWEILGRWYTRRAALRVVVLDGQSALAFAIARFLARLDTLGLLRFEESAGAQAELIAVRDPVGGQVYTGKAAFHEILQALPGGKLVRPFFTVLTLGMLGPILGLIARRRERVARFFGLTLPPRGKEHRDDPSPLRQDLRYARAMLRELVIVYLGVCAVSQSINENKVVWQPLKHKQPKFMEATLQYPRIFQGWGMFAPNPIQDDGSVTIAAITIDGRQIDPFTGAAPDLNLNDARGLGLPQIWQDYFNRIRLDRNKVFRQGLRDYLVQWHKETGRPEDELVAFDVYWVRDQCPRPGQTQPTKNETIALLTYRKPNYRPAPGLPPLPPEPKVASAGN
jgi:predicted DCC family thiol-disulfide oxidoreductase YuxK